MTKPSLNFALLLSCFLAFMSSPLFGQNTACVGDTIAPFFESCPQNMVINQSGSNTSNCSFVQWDSPLTYDNCGVASLTSNFSNGDCLPVGVTTVIYTAVDSSQNTSTCSFTVTVLAATANSCATDSISPILSNCPTNIVLTTQDTCAIANWTPPTATDNCSTPSVIGSHQSGTCFPLGYTNVLYTATDSMNNRATCSFVISVQNPCANDTIKPVFSSCPPNIALTTSGNCAAAQWAIPTATDNCGSVSVFATAQPGRCFSVGISTVTYRATDLKGNAGICSFTVNVSSPCAVDTIKPTISACPTNIVLTTRDTCAIATWVSPTAADNCSIAAIFPNIQSGSCFPIGTTPVIYTARDAKNNVSTCEFTVTVTDLCKGDTVKPVIANCPTNLILTTADSCAIAQWATPTITDNCSTPTLTATHGSASCFPIGVTTVVYTGKDAKNNTATCSFKVTVTALINTNTPCAGDTTKPVITRCPSNIVLTSDTCAVARWSAPRITDNCGTPTLTASHISGACFPVGVTTVTYTGKDSRNNTATCAFTVTVNKKTNPCPTDFIKPTLSRCPTNISLVSIDSCTFVNWTAPTATDNCGTPTVTASKERNTCFSFGTTTVVYTAKDNNNNSATCSFTVTITKPCANDTVKPRFPFCPTDISLITYDTCAKATWVMPVATDNCSSATVTGTHEPNMCFKVGVTNVVYTALDINNNKGLCAFKVTVTNPCLSDTTKPVLRNCPANIVINTADSCAKATWTAPSVTDNCGVPTLAVSSPSGTCFKIGLTTVTYTAKDTRGNTSVCNFTVTIINPCFRDSIKPVIRNCPASISLSASNSADSCVVARWIAPTATDNCGTPSVTGSHQSGKCFPVGSTTVTYTAKDAKNNVATCTFKVTVSNPCFNDTIKPVLYNCPESIVKTIPDTAVAITWRAPSALDNCGTVTLSASKPSNSLFPIGVTTVTYTAADAKNNKATCAFTVTIKRVITACSNDTVKPVFANCPANITLTTASATSIGQWALPTATDNCSVPSVTSTLNSGSSFSVGTTTVVITANDAAKNAATCSFTVTVIANKMAMAAMIDTAKCYALVVRSSKKAITVANGSSTAGANGVQWAFVNALSQKWKISLADSNSYYLSNKQSNLNLDTRWGSTGEGARLMQWGKNTTAPTQKWKIETLPDGYFKVINKASEKALSVSGGSMAKTDGSLLIQSNYSMQTSQQWSIVEVPCTSNIAAFATNDAVDMDAQAEFNRARIEWTDNTGYKNDYYEVQKMNPTSGDFERMEIVNNKSLTNAPTYEMVYDNAPNEGENVYRVKVVYLDSTSKVSTPKTLIYKTSETVKVFPNPANDFVDIDLAKYNNSDVTIYLYNNFGQQVAVQNVPKAKSSVVHFDVASQQNGNYLIRISAQGKRDVLKQLQIVK
jgi:hypothetical protein